MKKEKKLDDIWEEHYKNINLSKMSKEEKANCEREHEKKIWKEAQKELLSYIQSKMVENKFIMGKQIFDETDLKITKINLREK